MRRLLDYLPRGNTLDDEAWGQRHRFLQAVLALHIPGLLIFGAVRGYPLALTIVHYLAAPAFCLLLGRYVRRRRVASFFITAGLVYCSAALVALSGGAIEAHFHFFVLIGFIALYQDWVPFLWNIAFTVLSHGFGSAVRTDLIFNHHAAQASPWTWSAIHGIAVLAACVGVIVFWKHTERDQLKALALTRELSENRFDQLTSSLLVNLARRNQSLLYRQLDLINHLEEKERDADALGELFRLDHLATRIRRNGESLLVLSGEDPTRTWAQPVLLVDVVRAAIAEIESMERVQFVVDERLRVHGRAVADVTHLLAELIENAVAFSPPGVDVSVRSRPYLHTPGAHVLVVEDWGLGLPPDKLREANELLGAPRKVDLTATAQLGLHVVARLAARYGIEVSLTPTPGNGLTAVVLLPPTLFDAQPAEPVRLGSFEPVAPAVWADLHVGHAPNGSERSLRRPARPLFDPPVPVPVPEAPRPRAERPAAEPRLEQRVPRANLAPELRRRDAETGSQTGQAPVTAVPDPVQARAALSRYQASREAASALGAADQAASDGQPRGWTPDRGGRR